MIKLEHDFGSLVNKMTDVQKRQLPFATSLAINRTMQKVKAAEQREIIDVFNRPTPYIQNSIFLKPSTKRDLTAVVNIKDQSVKSVPPSKILSAQVTGGGRGLKRFEKALRSVGALPPGYVTVPGEGATLDAYGNMSRGQIVQILSYFKAFPEAGYKANSTKASRAKLKRGTKSKLGISYFVGRPGDGKWPFGIWQRIHYGFGTRVSPILIFVPSALYEAIFDFKYVADRTIKKEFGKEFSRAFTEAMRTAK